MSPNGQSTQYVQPRPGSHSQYSQFDPAPSYYETCQPRTHLSPEVEPRQDHLYPPRDRKQLFDTSSFPKNYRSDSQDINDKTLNSPYSPMSNMSCIFSDNQISRQAFASTGPQSPASTTSPPIRLPIAIPQVIPGGGQPFTRAWAPCLSSHGIGQQEFLAFIDDLNIVSTASPPLQVLNLAGGLLGMVPYHWATLAGFAIQASAQLGTKAVSMGRTEMYMKEANERLFVPNGLRVCIASRDAVARVVGLPANAPVVAPLKDLNISLKMSERCLQAMTGFVAELDFESPPVAEQTSLLAKMSAAQIQRQVEKSEKDVLKKQEKALKEVEKKEAKNAKNEGSRQRGESVSESDVEGMSRKELKRQRSREKKQKKREKEEEKEAKKSHERKSKDKEIKNAEKLLWVLIENL